MTTQHLDTVAAHLQQLSELTSAIEKQVSELRKSTDAYAEAAHQARADGAPLPSFSGTAAHALAGQLVNRLTVAGQQVGYIATQTARLVGY